MSQPSRQGILCVVSGPSGSGKTTLCHRMAKEMPGCAYSVSCTTRDPRPGEVDGVDYHFLSPAEFEERIAHGELLEHAQVHGRHHYGTLKGPVIASLNKGLDVLMDLDVQGAAQLREVEDETVARSLVDVFILPRSLDELAERIRNRGPMAPDEFAARLRNAEEEMRHWRHYRYTLISGSKEEDFAAFRTILDGERHASQRLNLPEMGIEP